MGETVGGASALSHEDLFAVAARLTAEAGLGRPLGIRPLAGGANNRVLRVDAAGGTAVLKAYLRDPDDGRDRLAAEWTFGVYAWGLGLRCLPRPLAVDVQAGAALYAWLEGEPPRPGVVTGEMVREAVAFFRALDAGRDRPEARALPAASEACFSLEAHLCLVNRRVDRLLAMGVPDEVHRDALCLVEGELAGAWREVEARTRREARRAGLDLDRELGAPGRRLSPSDFGFHNALRGPDGRLAFLDFEYAGWDDPAKTYADFCCQIAVPVGAEHRDAFLEGVVGGLPGEALHRERARLLLPVYRVKWCCIALNGFLGAGDRRRRFALPHGSPDGSEAETRARGQLAKARAILAQV